MFGVPLSLGVANVPTACHCREKTRPVVLLSRNHVHTAIWVGRWGCTCASLRWSNIAFAVNSEPPGSEVNDVVALYNSEPTSMLVDLYH